jgi:hypothetical protein
MYQDVRIPSRILSRALFPFSPCISFHLPYGKVETAFPCADRSPRGRLLFLFSGSGRRQLNWQLLEHVLQQLKGHPASIAR